ncbi:helix-turn-helix domain containing protein [Streptomyces sp. NBS 14/10]|uniref:TetR/AcrR family transcriptional regulator n=1 Tax=Streptomyces sp. NBS 14/10 TaxID=1945643 RepID=UPI000B7DE95C|nr:TetR/AcrR family transcriptional regulator [Streptomyces sp. NBS 14/10]KAK1180199.1 helix-turn-helix domain containing protein [Streptomyces sp. NBS 14/10]NUS86606.1 helix-turn-helix transcriptional regulator [Streptomyces sp.]
MGNTPQARRGDTRQRIQDVALELFAEQGYEKTSLREIAERLEVTKAALYYHFKTKEDILISLFQDLARPLDELLAWGQQQPRTLETKQELIRRYSVALESALPLFRFMQQNQAAMSHLRPGETLKDRMIGLSDLLRDPNAPLTDQVRSLSAIFVMHTSQFAMQHIDVGPEEKRKAALEVALDLLAQAHPQERSDTPDAA